jgi:hypothetical protein
MEFFSLSETRLFGTVSLQRGPGDPTARARREEKTIPPYFASLQTCPAAETSGRRARRLRPVWSGDIAASAARVVGDTGHEELDGRIL